MADIIEEALDPDSFLSGMRHAMRLVLDRPYGMSPEDAQMRAYNKIVLKREQEERVCASDQS